MYLIKLSVFLLTILFIINCSRTPNIPEFDQNSAFDLLKKQCEFGPRVPNSDAHKRCGQFLYDNLITCTSVVRRQQFGYYDSERNDTLKLTNFIASFNPENKQRLLLAAHWDCRPWADNEPDSSLHNKPIMGANDGASGVAILLTLASVLKKSKPTIGVDIVLLDGEDYGTIRHPEEWLLGSQYFVRFIGGYRPFGVILLDLVGDADLNIHREYYSQNNALWLTDKIWRAAEIEKAPHFFPDVKHRVYDDHIPFLKVGIPAVDIVDMDYKYWHTLEDTPDKCSPASLAEVGRVILRFIYDQDLRLAGK